MSHEQGDNLAGWITGAFAPLVVQLYGWSDAPTVAGDVLHTLVFGFLGGAVGYLGKKGVETLLVTIKSKTKKSE